MSFDGNALVIGGDDDGGGFAFGVQARVDEVRIYDRALTPTEITRLTTP